MKMKWKKPVKHNSSGALIEMWLKEHPGATLDDMYKLTGKSPNGQFIIGTPIHPEEKPPC